MQNLSNHNIFEGTIYHKRFLPKKHDFKYNFYLLDIDVFDLKSLETAGILDELLDRFSGEAGDLESVQYQELLEQLALDRTDPKTFKEVNELLNRLTDQRSTENPENPEKYISENPENPENPAAYISGNGENGENGEN
ncbi:MAG: DUF1365 family protein, partial [Arcobacter sp.]|nr:DUF1365 family protein [Arcobacter sp.]